MAEALLAARPAQRKAEAARSSPAGARHERLERRPAARAEAGLRSLLEARVPAAPAPIQRAARPNRTGLPDRLKAGIETLSGLAMDDVKVHYGSPKPAQLQAHAYTQGSDIHVAAGQERHLAHEAWHVVQQKQGRVPATARTAEGVSLNTDASLESEADRLGRKALAIPDAGGNPKMGPPQGRAQPVQRRATGSVIQAKEVSPTYGSATKATTVNLKLEIGDWPSAGSGTGSTIPDGWQQIKDLGVSAGWVRFHVLNQRSGGKGIKSNLVPTTQQINQNQSWKTFESSLKIYVDPEHSLGTGAPAASDFQASVTYYTSGDDHSYQKDDTTIVVKGQDFPALITAALDVKPGEIAPAGKLYSVSLGPGDGLIAPKDIKPVGWT